MNHLLNLTFSSICFLVFVSNRMKSLSIICLLILIISTVAEQSESKLNSIFLILLQILFLDSENTEEFIPTNEWQIVKEGIFHKFTYKKY